MNVAYGVCVGSDEKFERYVLPRAALSVIYTRREQSSIAAAYNGMLDDAQGDGFDVLIFQHDDLEITDPDGEEKLVEAVRRPGIALAGVAGGGGSGGLAWWNMAPVGHQKTDAMNIDFGQREGVVDLLEGSIMAFGRWAIESLRFHPRPGFHGYDEIAMQAGASGYVSVVVDVDTWHHNAMGFKSAGSHEEWLEADRWYRQKWGFG